MAVWLHGGALLLLLAISTAGVNAAAQQHLCGHDLVDALYLVCGPTGFSYYPHHNREVHPLLGFFPPKSGQDGEMMMKQGIVEQCCFKPCSIFDLQDFCD